MFFSIHIEAGGLQADKLDAAMRLCELLDQAAFAHSAPAADHQQACGLLLEEALQLLQLGQ